MKSGMLEHVNVTVTDTRATAERLVRLFGWSIRWEGPAIHDGRTIHVGLDDSYVALYSPRELSAAGSDGTPSYDRPAGLNHIGVVVDDLDAVEARVVAEGLEPHSHADYEPGRRFYFFDPDGIEFEVVEYR